MFTEIWLLFSALFMKIKGFEGVNAMYKLFMNLTIDIQQKALQYWYSLLCHVDISDKLVI